MKVLGEEIEPISQISPSNYQDIITCSFKFILSRTFKKPFLPNFPESYLGSIIHKCLENITKGIIKTEEDLNIVWKKEIEKQVKRIKEDGYDFLLPLENIPYFGLKKLQVKKYLNARPKENKQIYSSQVNYLPEKEYEFQDGQVLIKGKPDLIRESEKITIYDYKSGKIIDEEEDDIKEEYQNQLKLYAYLYYKVNGRFPDELILVDLAKKEYLVEFTNEECLKIGFDIKAIIEKINKNISLNNFSELANPNEKNCKYCLYRPACNVYLEDYITKLSPSIDVLGELKEIKDFKNGNFNVLIENNEERIIISRLNSYIAEKIKNKIGEKVIFFNIRFQKSDDTKKINYFTSTKRTILQE